ncbi:hypothetical protein EPUL_004915, partial [Erysiphe pulchra]
APRDPIGRRRLRTGERCHWSRAAPAEATKRGARSQRASVRRSRPRSSRRSTACKMTGRGKGGKGLGKGGAKRHHQARHPPSGPPRRCQAYLGSHLRGDPRRPQGVPRERRRSPPWTSSTPSSVKAAPSTVSAVKHPAPSAAAAAPPALAPSRRGVGTQNGPFKDQNVSPERATIQTKTLPFPFPSSPVPGGWHIARCAARRRSMRNNATRVDGVLGHGLGAFGDGVLGQLAGEQQPHGGLDLPGGDGRPLVVVGEPAGLRGDALEDVVDERVHDAHRLRGNAGIGVHLLKYFINVDGVGLLPFAFLLLVALADVLLGLAGLLGGLSGRLGGHGESSDTDGTETRTGRECRSAESRPLFM